MKIKKASVLALGILAVSFTGCAQFSHKTASTTSTPAVADGPAPIAEGPSRNAWGNNFPASY